MKYFLAALLFGVACGEKEVGEGATPGDCTDGADNDEDGDFDCNDDGCAGSPDCQGSSDTDTNDTGSIDTDDTDTDDEIPLQS